MRDLGDNAIIYVYTDEFMGSMDGINGLSGRRVFYYFHTGKNPKGSKNPSK